MSLRRGDAIEAIHLFGLPIALNFDQSIAPDGFAVRVFASSHRQAKGVAIRSGTLEILMFDGTLGTTDPRSIKPARVWSFSGASLTANATTSSLGIGYGFTLRWEGARPVRSRITVVARFIPPGGSALYSAPSVIPITTN